MVFCMVALLLPESLWARTATVSGDTATIGTTRAILDGTTLTVTCNATTSGELEKVGATVNALLTNDEAKAAVTKIKFEGNITSSDLSALGSSNGFIAVKTVDMAEAHIVQEKNSNNSATSSSWTWYNSTEGVKPPVGTIACFGGTLYQLSVDKEWTAASGTPWTELVYPDETTMRADASQPANTYAKIGTYKYCQLTVTDETWGPATTSDPGNAIDPSFSENERNSHLSEFVGGQSIRYIRYFKKIEAENQWGGEWVPCTKDEYDAMQGTHYENMTGVDLDHLLHQNGAVGDGMWCYVYYIKSGTRTWSEGQSVEPSGTIKNASFVYSDRENHKYDSGFSNGDWVKMLDGYNYYQYTFKSGASDRHWTAVGSETTYKTNVSLLFANTTERDANTTATDGQYAVVGGQMKFYTGHDWIDPGDVEMVENYAEMKFSYWSGTLENAITSKYAEETITGDIFQNCNNLKTVDFKAGNVIGLKDRGNEGDVADLSVTIGKNVTSISNDAFKACKKLKTITFDTDYTVATGQDMLTGVHYPLEMTIGENAFLQAWNLTGEIKIPNRVKAIGTSAFKEAGNTAENDDFRVTFERRRNQDDTTVSMDYDVNLTIGETAFEKCNNLKTISIPIRLESMGKAVFRDSGLESFEIREDVEDSRLDVIPEEAFLRTKLKNITIPRSVIEIQQSAFTECKYIEEVHFQKQNTDPQETLIIRSGAFSGGDEKISLKDVYVEFSPSERLVVCEYNAFGFTSLVGQTDVASSRIAKLHFPPEDWDYYAGDWKRGLAFLQANLDAIKGGYQNAEKGYVGIGTNDQINYVKGTTNAGKAVHAEAGKEYTPANGWQQFAWTSTGIDIVIPNGSFIRTYSTKEPMVIPTYASANSLPSGVKVNDPMFKIYRITKFVDGYTEGNDEKPAEGVTPTATAEEVVETISGRNYIPNNTGLIMISNGGDQSFLVYLSNIPVLNPVQYPYENKLDNIKVNLLYPSCIDNQPGFTVTDSYVSLKPTVPYPYYGDAPDYRIFGLWAAERCFSRVLANMTRDKAYLKLPASMFHYSNEGEHGTGQVLPSQQQSSAPIMLSFLDPEGETTAVRMLNPETMSVATDCYYTLQGMKLSARPTEKGIYIYKGKKVVIK